MRLVRYCKTGMGLNLNNIYQRPYVLKDGRTLVKKKQDEDAQKTLTQAEQEERANSQGRSRGLQYTQGYQNITPAQSQRAQQLYGQYSYSAGGQVSSQSAKSSGQTAASAGQICNYQYCADS